MFVLSRGVPCTAESSSSGRDARSNRFVGGVLRRRLAARLAVNNATAADDSNNVAVAFRKEATRRGFMDAEVPAAVSEEHTNACEQASRVFDSCPATRTMIWEAARLEAQQDSKREPVLASFMYSTILAHNSVHRSMAFLLANKLASPGLLSTQLMELFCQAYERDEALVAALHADLQAVLDRDPACKKYTQCMLFFKGFQALQSYRIAHHLWTRGRHALALVLQSRISEVFAVDIHPAASLGQGVMLDHATGVVIGETAVVGNNVSILHHVTLGGTGATCGDRHPKVGSGVLIGAGVTILGNINIGCNAKIGAGSVVLKDVPVGATAVGVPARVLKERPKAPGVAKEAVQAEPALEMDQTSFIDLWQDYVI